MRIPPQRQRKIHTVDQAYEEFLQRYIETLLDQKKEGYHSELEPFDVYAEKVKKDVSDYFHHFHECFLNGYEVLIKQLKKR